MSAEAGMVVAHTDTGIGTGLPAGWALCNGGTHTSQDLYDQIGSWNVPNLTDKFIRGAGATPIRTVGGQASVALTVAQMPNHNHGAATVAGGGAHNHTGAATSPQDRSLNHAHTGTTGTESHDHTHAVGAFETGTVSAWHTHDILVNDGGGSGDGGNYVDTNPSADGSGRPDVGVTNTVDAWHIHAAPTTWSGGVSHNHRHDARLADANIDHTHTFTSGAPSAAHTHTITAVGSGTAVNLVPAHYAVVFIICL